MWLKQMYLLPLLGGCWLGVSDGTGDDGKDGADTAGSGEVGLVPGPGDGDGVVSVLRNKCSSMSNGSV